MVSVVDHCRDCSGALLAVEQFAFGCVAVLWFAPNKLKLPMCVLIWAGLVFDIKL